MKINNVQDDIKKQEIAYGLEILMATILEFAVAIVISVICKYFIECIVFLVVFSSLRTYSGGYHAKTHIRCFMILIMDIFIGAILLESIPLNYYSLISTVFLLICGIMVFLFAPIEHVNHPLSKRQKKKYRKVSCIIACIFVFLVIVSIALKYERIYFSASYALFSVSMSMLAVKIKLLTRRCTV